MGDYLKENNLWVPDIADIPELPKDGDAYWTDRDGNIGVLSYIGVCNNNDKVFMILGGKFDQRIIQIPMVDLLYKDGAACFHIGKDARCDKKVSKNDAIFNVIEDTCRAQLGFYMLYIRSREVFLKLIELVKNTCYYYVVTPDLSVQYKSDYRFQGWRRCFLNEEDARRYYISIVRKTKNKIVNTVKDLKALRKKLISVLPIEIQKNGSQAHGIKASLANVGEQYVSATRIDSVRSYDDGHFRLTVGAVSEPFTVIKKAGDGDNVVCFYDNGKVGTENEILISLEDYGKYKANRIYRGVFNDIDLITYWINTSDLEHDMKELDVPFAIKPPAYLVYKINTVKEMIRDVETRLVKYEKGRFN